MPKSSFDEVRELLARAAKTFHTARGSAAVGRAEQFDSHLATAQMAVDHAEDEITTKEGA